MVGIPLGIVVFWSAVVVGAVATVIMLPVLRKMNTARKQLNLKRYGKLKSKG